MRHIPTVWMIIIALLLACLSVVCDHARDNVESESILVRIADKTISVNEFIRRAEYTIRPPYCRGGSMIHKKIVLNTLIAEKLLALEAGENNALASNKEFRNTIRGRSEQAMRQWLYANDFVRPVNLDSTEIARRYRLANRRYQIAYLTVKDSTVLRIVKEKLDEDLSLETIHRMFGGLSEIPAREVRWEDAEHPAVHKALFTRPLNKDEIIGPVQIETDFHTVIQILGWREQVPVTDTEVQDRWNAVSERIRIERADSAFNRFVETRMRGRRMTFHPETFVRFVRLAAPLYMVSDTEKEDAFNQRFWQEDNPRPHTEDFSEAINEMADQPFLTLDKETWTVARFIDELEIHPLVFRKRRMKSQEFAEQFRLAVADMVRDKAVTEEARKRGCDRAPAVVRNAAMWRDALTALYQRNQFLESQGRFKAFTANQILTLETALNPYIDALQQKYGRAIFIDTDAFNKIELTHIDAFALQRDTPFPIVVPAFPILTTDHLLDFGQKLARQPANRGDL